MGQRLPRCATHSPTLPPFLARLRFRPAALRPLVVPTAAPASFRNRRHLLARLRPLATRSATAARAGHRESPADRHPLRVSLPLRPRHLPRPDPLRAHLYAAASARLRSAAPRRGPRTAAKTAQARRRASLRRTSRQVLAQLSHLPRSRPGGLDVARWP